MKVYAQSNFGAFLKVLNIICYIWILLPAFCIGCKTSESCIRLFKRPRILNQDELTGVWISRTPNSWDYYRLVLETNGTGRLGILSVHNTVSVYSIDSWSYVAPNVNVISHHEVTTNDCGAKQFSARSVGGNLVLTVSYGHFNRQGDLIQECELLGKIEQVRQCMIMSEVSNFANGDSLGANGVNPENRK